MALGSRINRTHRQILASVSKQFTAMAVMMLAERGKIHYDDSIAKLYPFAEGSGAQGSPSDIF